MASSPKRTQIRFSQPDDVFQLKISLLDIRPLIYRRIQVRQDLPLSDLHRVIQIAMGWTDTHLHQFKVGDVAFGGPTSELWPAPIDYRRVTLNQILRKPGASCIYEYDFGDCWKHLVELEDQLPKEQGTPPIPRCVAGERACPPEDVGGPPGYREFLDAIQNPKSPDDERFRQWDGVEFDPEAFDIERVNRRLSRIASLPGRRRGR